MIITAAGDRGCKATGLTLSDEQKTLTNGWIKSAILENQARVLLGNDLIVSVGMSEYVGPQFMN